MLRAYLDAQRQYASRDRDGDNVLQYAQKLGSTPGKQDGLYWPADAAKDDEQSPFGPLVAESAAYLKGHKEGDPYRGYHFKILTRQGKSAPGGAYNYVINGRMIAGFAMVAYPAQYGESGVMTFIVSNNGKVYEKDLGENSLAAGAAMTTFDPGPGWKEVQGLVGAVRPRAHRPRSDDDDAPATSASARRSRNSTPRTREDPNREAVDGRAAAEGARLRRSHDARCSRASTRTHRRRCGSPRAASTSSAGKFRAPNIR